MGDRSVISGRKRGPLGSTDRYGDKKHKAIIMLNSKKEVMNDKTENKNIVIGDVYHRKQYRREAIIRWREKRGKCPIICSHFLDKRQYRREAIIRWKLNRNNHTSASKFAISISGETSKVFSDVLIDKNQYKKEAIERWKKKKSKRTPSCLAYDKAKRNTTASAETSAISGPPLDLLPNVLMDKKQYRRAAIDRWKKKTAKKRVLLPPSCLANDKALKKSINVGKTGYMRRQLNNRIGKHLLQQVPFASDVLPDVRRCRYCDAVKFYSETTNFCCLDGRVVLSNNELPLLMQDLLTSTSKEAISFRTYIRTYNNHFAFTSFGVTADNELSKRNKGIYTFRVQGQVYHFINDLSPKENDSKNLQLYFHDTDNELENRLSDSPRLCIDLIAKCVEYLKDNPYARFFRNLRDVPNLDECKIILKTIPGQDQRVFNKPEVSQVAAIWIEGQENGEHGRRSIEVKLHSDCSRSVQYYYGCYDPLQYPLMFPFGELGWHQHIPKKKDVERGNGRNVVSTVEKLISPVTATSAEYLLDMEENVLAKNSESSKYISVREYYAYKLQIRRHDKSYLLQFGRLLQQYIVDSYVKLETQRLAFFRTQQADIRQEFLQGIVDAMASGESEASAIGRRVVLPATFIGGTRNMRRKYIDAMALVQKFGKPDLFLTLTCNPNWPEIRQHMMTHEETHNRADLIVRVFHAKLELFKNEILKKNIFGKVAAYTYVIEFQKRGLPHAHFLLILEHDFKMYEPKEYDEIVCAELPDEHSNPHLHKMVVKHMLHGPCGDLNLKNVCMKNGTCKNSYPKEFCHETTQTNAAYPTYRRRNNGVSVIVRGAKLDNRWVVPYNAYLLCKFDCHVNIEICSTIKAVKYIYKYICKGCDKISFAVTSNYNSECIDEIQQFQSGRWISAPEGAWRIYRFLLGDIKPAVIHLALHLENYQPITFNKRQRLSDITKNPDRKKTMLTEFFFNNATDRYAQKLNLTYVQYPDHFTWKGAKKMWSPRQSERSIGRIVIAHPSEGERYYLRILLSKIRCPKSYDDLKFFNGLKVATFRESALLCGYLIDDNSQQLCLQEASIFHMPYELRRLFATILVYTCPNNPHQLWSSFEDMMLEDLVNSNKYTHREARKHALQQVDFFLQSIGRQLHEFDVLPHDFSYNDLQDETRDIRAEKV